HAGIEPAMMGDGVLGIARCEEHADLGTPGADRVHELPSVHAARTTRARSCRGNADCCPPFVIPGRCEASNPESRDSGSGAVAPSWNDGAGRLPFEQEMTVNPATPDDAKRTTTVKNLLTDISGVRVGHADDARLASGVTAILFDKPAVAAIDVRGGGPGT